MHRTHGSKNGLVLLGALLLLAGIGGPVRAVQDVPDPAPSPAGDAVAGPTADEPDAGHRLQELYRELYEIQLAIGRRTTDAVERDSLLTRRADLLERIRQLARRQETPAPAELPPPPGQGDDLSVLEEELGRLADDVDWEALSRALEGNAQGLGEGLEALAGQLKGLQIEVGPERLRIQNDSGSRFSVTIPPEVREDIRAGIRDLGEELHRVLNDSSRASYSEQFQGLLGELPEDVRVALPSWTRRAREKKVVARSVFRTGADFEVHENEIVRGDVVLLAGDCYVAGEVEGNVIVVFGDLVLERRARIGKDAISLGGRVEADQGSEVLGRRLDLGAVVPGLGAGTMGSGGGWVWFGYGAKVAVLAMLLILTFALGTERMLVMTEQGAANPTRHLVFGSFWLLVVLGAYAVSTVGLVISVIGIPVALVASAALVLALLVSYFVGCQVLGSRLLRLSGVDGARADWQVGALGLVVLEIPALLAVSFQGHDVSRLLWGADVLVKLLVIGVGFGAALRTRFGMRVPATAIEATALPAAPGA